MLKVRILISIVMLLICSFEDIRDKKINIVTLLVSGVVGEILRLFSEENLAFNAVAVSLIPGIALLILTRFFKGIGDGDAYVFIALGMLFDLKVLLLTLYLAFISGGIYALYLKLYRRANSDDGFAFVPFITLGFLICIASKIITEKVLYP